MVSRVARTTLVSAAVAVWIALAAVPAPVGVLALDVTGERPKGERERHRDLGCKPAGPIQIDLLASAEDGVMELRVRPRLPLSDLRARIVGPQGVVTRRLDPTDESVARVTVPLAGPSERSELRVTGIYQGSDGPELVTVRRRWGGPAGPVGTLRPVGKGRAGRKIALPVAHDPAG